MRSLSCIIILILGAVYIFPQSPHGDKLKMDCSNCHESSNWKIIPPKIKFDHNTETAFKLSGQHATASCQSCHKSLIFSNVKSQCISCHQDVHKNSLGPNCVQCHNTQSWIAVNIIKLHQDSRFPLIGVHQNVDCQSCHSGYADLYFPTLSTSCFSCHQSQFAAATSPNHVQSNFSTNCRDCHSVTDFSWGTSHFNHDFFPLIGGHNIQNCFACHAAGSNFKGLTTACYPCHKQDFVNAKNPDHVAAKFPTACQDCHTSTAASFNQATFNHNTTGFPLTGAHQSVSCQSCHNGNYTNTHADCYSCHATEYSSTNNPNHVQQGFSHDCTQCHNTTSFGTGTFDHNTTGFALTGAHATVSCQSCHNGNYTSTPTTCYSCHNKDYANTTNPNHAQQGFSHDCSQCHSTTSFGDGTFNHSTTGFPLTGAHTTVTCQSCHNGNYTSTPTTCYSCHAKDYNGTTNPNHAAIGLAQTCQDCHTTTNFTTSTFNHSTTPFPLTGAHVTVSCQSCHTTGAASSTPTDCYSCHATQYNGTTDPNHAQQGFSHDCSQCHSTTSFGDASFNHNNTGFPLTGAHTTVTCQSCHNGNYTSTSAACFACHATDYNSTTNPPHQAAGYPTDCTQCHTTTAFTTSTFNHTQFFPLTGSHNTTCANCHQTISNFAVHSCNAVCHKDAHHQNEDCYTCHPTGQGG